MTTQSAPATASCGSVVRLTRPPSRRAQSSSARRRAELLGAGEPQRKAEADGGVNPARRDVVAVAAPGHDLAGDRPLLFLQGHHVGHDLARVRGVGQPVDHRHGRVARQLVELLRLVGADHDRVDIARQHARRVGDGLAAAELAVGGVQKDRIAAELAHRHLERDAGPGRRLLEDHRQGLAGERPVAPAVLVGDADIEDAAQLGAVELVDVEEVARAGGVSRPSTSAAAPVVRLTPAIPARPCAGCRSLRRSLPR